MAYTKTTWVDEVLAGAERFDIKENGGDAFKANMQIVLATGVTVGGTSVDATNLNHIETGIYDLSRGAALSVKGITGNATGDVADIAAGTDGHVLRRSGTTLAFGTVAAAGIGADAINGTKIADDSIDSEHYVDGSIDAIHLASAIVDDSKIGNRVMKVVKRMGADANSWDIPSTSNSARDLTTVKMQLGVAEWTVSSYPSGTVTLTFPVAFSKRPLVFLSSAQDKLIFHATTPSASSCVIQWHTIDGSNQTDIIVNWIAIAEA